MKKLLVVAIFLGTVSLNADINLQAGKKVYQENCAICHTISGGGGMGPDFNMVAYTRHKEEIEYYAKDPYSLYKTFGYSANAMPTLPLEDQQFKDVAAYISSLQPFKKWMIKTKKELKIETLENNSSENNNSNNFKIKSEKKDN